MQAQGTQCQSRTVWDKRIQEAWLLFFPVNCHPQQAAARNSWLCFLPLVAFVRRLSRARMFEASLFWLLDREAGTGGCASVRGRGHQGAQVAGEGRFN